MPIYGEFPGQKLQVDGMLIKAIIFICITRPASRISVIISNEVLNDLLTDDSTPF